MKIKVLSKKVTITGEKGKENVFYRYFSPVNIQVLENGKDMGVQEKSISVHFTKKAMKQIEDEQIFAIIDGDISLPYVYEVKTDEKTGELVYPEIWVREIKSMKKIPYKGKENTCVPILDEDDESEPVEIVE